MLTECSQCGLQLLDSHQPQPETCPNCGSSLAPVKQREISGWGLIRNYFIKIWSILSHPSQFFRDLPLTGGISSPLTFALITHWLSSAFVMLWHFLLGHPFISWFSKMTSYLGNGADIDSIGQNSQLIQMKDRILGWFFGAGGVIADPFLTLVSILGTSSLVYLGARILVSPGKDDHPAEITYESAVRLVCYGMTPVILATFPFFGGIVGSFYIFAVTAIGAREIYRISTLRGLIIALFPKLLFLGILLVGILTFAVMIVKFMSSFF